MSDQPPNESSEEQEISEEKPSRRLRLPRRKTDKADNLSPDTPIENRRIREEIIKRTIEPAQATIGKLQRRLGEDYYVILDKNPIIGDTLSRASLIFGNQTLLLTSFNIHWVTTLFWSGSLTGTVKFQHEIGEVVGEIFHYGPGHIKQWDEVNKFMDTAVGRGHRLKFGHTTEYLPEIVERFGIEGVPAYYMHLLQDFTTIDGIPILRNAWDVKKRLESAGLSHKMATRLVSINFSRMLAMANMTSWLYEIWQLGDSTLKKSRRDNYLKTATSAAQNNDYTAAIVNFQKALEIDRAPEILISLGNVYMQRAANRLKAHQAFTEAVKILSTEPDATTFHDEVGLSLRGIAGIQALATGDVLSDIHPEHWNDYIQDLVNATVYSFVSTAEKQFEGRVAETLVAPARFSAAINYYLAAKSAGYYPLAQNRQEVLVHNLQQSLRCLGLVAQYDENRLREPISTIQKLWVMELTPPDEIESAMATYI